MKHEVLCETVRELCEERGRTHHGLRVRDAGC
jgi:hypothetical protein